WSDDATVLDPQVADFAVDAVGGIVNGTAGDAQERHEWMLSMCRERLTPGGRTAMPAVRGKCENEGRVSAENWFRSARAAAAENPAGAAIRKPRLDRAASR